MSTNLPTHWNASKVRAIELLVSKPSARIKDVAEESGVSSVTIHKWLKDPEFVEVFYQRYMISFGSRLPSVLNSMIIEAEAGNVQAGRLVLEHSGKLIKRVEVANHQSPFEKFLNAEIAVVGPYSKLDTPTLDTGVSIRANKFASVIFLFTGDALKSIICNKSAAALPVLVNSVKAVIFLSAIILL